MHRYVGVLVVVAIALSGGCSSRPVTNTPRSAIEQLLLSGAVDRALEKFDPPKIRGKKVYIDFSLLSCYDKEYVQLASRVRFAELGARLVDAADQADWVAQVASGALGTEFKSEAIGMPALPVPNSPVATPEMTAHRSGEQTGIAKLLIAIYEKGRLVSAVTCYDKCDRVESFVFGAKFEPTDEIREAWTEADYERRAKQGEMLDTDAP